MQRVPRHVRKACKLRKDRGVALIIVLLVTALLIALVFEFAYGTRVSLRAAVNFRDSQRAYYLARSGVNFTGALLSDNLKNNKPQDNLEQREWQVVPLMTGSDTELKVRWEDEKGKININTISTSLWVGDLFEQRGVGVGVGDNLKELIKERPIQLLSELHKVLSDEDFNKVAKFLTVYSDKKIDINTAPEEVLSSVLTGQGNVSSLSTIISTRKDRPYTSVSDAGLSSAFFDVSSNIFKVYSSATVGRYTKQVEAVITRSTAGFSISYWKAL